ncbi:MAG: hypothetical protein EP348_09800, partial [Alphaproteobacteria bacterium]
MPFKNILVPLSGSADDTDAQSLESAFHLATRYSGHVNALHIKIDPRTAAAFVGEGMTSTMIESVIEMAEKDGESRLQRAHALFNDISSRMNIQVIHDIKDRNSAGASARFVEKQGNREDTLHSYGRLFDLIVICKQSGDEEMSNSLIIQTALRETGRPVLLMDRAIPADCGKRVALAWNGSVESSRAMTYSLPFLKAAEKVMLISNLDDLEEDLHPEAALRY